VFGIPYQYCKSALNRLLVFGIPYQYCKSALNRLLAFGIPYQYCKSALIRLLVFGIPYQYHESALTRLLVFGIPYQYHRSALYTKLHIVSERSVLMTLVHCMPIVIIISYHVCKWPESWDYWYIFLKLFYFSWFFKRRV